MFVQVFHIGSGPDAELNKAKSRAIFGIIIFFFPSSFRFRRLPHLAGIHQPVLLCYTYVFALFPAGATWSMHGNNLQRASMRIYLSFLNEVLGS